MVVYPRELLLSPSGSVKQSKVSDPRVRKVFSAVRLPTLPPHLAGRPLVHKLYLLMTKLITLVNEEGVIRRPLLSLRGLKTRGVPLKASVSLKQ